MFRVKCRFGSSLEPKDTQRFIRGVRAVPVSQMADSSSEAEVQVYFRKHVLCPGARPPVLACPSPSHSVQFWLPLHQIGAKAWSADELLCLWVLFSPPRGFLCSVDTDHSIHLEILSFFGLLWPRALLLALGVYGWTELFLPLHDSLLCPFLHIPALTCVRLLLLLFSLRAMPHRCFNFQVCRLKFQPHFLFPLSRVRVTPNTEWLLYSV